MIQMQTKLDVADNSGAKQVQCIKVLGGSKRRTASVGDIIVVSVKEAIPRGKVKKGKFLKRLLFEQEKKYVVTMEALLGLILMPQSLLMLMANLLELEFLVQLLANCVPKN